MYKTVGFTLLELLITVAIVTIILVSGVPATINLIEQKRFEFAVQNSYFLLMKGKAQAVSLNRDVTVQFNSVSPWCIGLSDSGPCDCKALSSCTVNGVTEVLNAEDFPGITMQDVDFNGGASFVFDGVRGLNLSSPGGYALSRGTTVVEVEVNSVGRVNICVEQGELGGYESC